MPSIDDGSSSSIHRENIRRSRVLLQCSRRGNYLPSFWTPVSFMSSGLPTRSWVLDWLILLGILRRSCWKAASLFDFRAVRARCGPSKRLRPAEAAGRPGRILYRGMQFIGDSVSSPIGPGPAGVMYRKSATAPPNHRFGVFRSRGQRPVPRFGSASGRSARAAVSGCRSRWSDCSLSQCSLPPWTGMVEPHD